MKEEENTVPKLRFPEFRDAGEWDVAGLGVLTEFVNERIPIERLKLADYVSTENILPDYSGVAKASKLPSTGSATRFRPNDTLVSNIRPYLKKVWFSDKDGGASNDVIVIRAKHELLTQYFPFLLKNDSFIDYVMKDAKGVKMPRGDIASMKAYPAFYPTKPEQQKIANCLSSLDELMAAQARKLDALKTHKKGLMQQLFPREGETQPRLRFPEFRDAGEWMEKTLNSFCKVGDIDHKMPSSEVEGIPYIMTGDFLGINNIDFDNAKKISAEDYEQLSKKIKPEFGDIVIARYASVGAVRYIETNIKFLVSYSCAIIKCNRSEDSKYLYYIFQSDVIQSKIGLVINKSSQKNIGIESIKKLNIFLPTLPEQQHIADCLTNLDDLITTQTQKLEALKTHKKGLMQQLFPNPEEVEA